MFVAAILVGLMTAYYVDLRAGLIAGVAAVVLFMVADTFPSLTVPVYILTGIWVCGICWIGPTLGRQQANQVALRQIAIQIFRKLKGW